MSGNIPIQGTLTPNGSFPIIDGPVQCSPSTPAVVTIYVRPAGNDINDGKTPATAFRTVQHALNTIPLIQRSVRYIVDITGINDTNQSIHMPPYFNGDGLGTDSSPPCPGFTTLGYVTIRATPTVLYTLNAGTTTGVEDPVTTMVKVTDTSANWTPDQWKGKFIMGAGPFQGGVIVSNDATNLYTTSFAGGPSYPYVFPVQILDTGATLTSAGGLAAPIHIDGVRAPIVFQGVNLPSAGAGAGSIRSDIAFDYIQFSVCAVGELQVRGGGGKVFWDTTFLQGHGGGVQSDANNDFDQIETEFSYWKDCSPGLANALMSFVCSIFENCRMFDTGGDGGCPTDFALIEFIGQGLLVMSMSMRTIDIKVTNAVPVAHVNPNGSAIHVMGGGSLGLAEGAVGGSGSAGYGIEVTSGGTVWLETGEPVTATITGALGDIKVGENPVRTWTDFNSGASGLPALREVDSNQQSVIGVNLQVGPSGQFGTGAIVWKQGEKPWSEILLLIKAVNARGGFANVYLDAGETFNAFTIDVSANLDNVRLISARLPRQVIVNVDPAFQLLGTGLHLAGISMSTSGTIWAYDAGQPARGIQWDLEWSALNPVPGAPQVATLGGSFINTVKLTNGSFLQGDNPPGNAAFSMLDGSTLTAYVYSQSNFDGTMVKLAGGATAADFYVFPDATSVDETAFYPINPGITLHASPGGDAKWLAYNPANVGNWPEGAPAQVASGLDKLAARKPGGIDEANAGYALEFVRTPLTGDAEQAQAVICGGPFVPDATDLAPCLYEAWVAPADDAPGIIFVIGIGGLHAMLLEFNSSGPGTQNFLVGNMYFDDPGEGIGFESYDGVWPGEPAHVAAMWDGTNVLLFVNGLCSAKFPTPVGYHRRSQSTASGGILCINSNGHAQRGGLVQQVRIWDGLASAPPTLPKLGNNYEVFPGPESIFGATFAFGDGTFSDCQFLMSFAQPEITPADRSPAGMLGKFHAGNLVNMRVTNGLIQGSPGNVYPRPKYVPAPLFPSGLVDTPRAQPIFHKPASAQPTPPAVAGSLLSADDFSDGWNTYAFDNGVLFEGLGLTLPQLRASKYGSLGALPYDQKQGYTSLTGPAAFGTDNSGNAVGLDPTPATATVDLGVADYDVMVERVGPGAPEGTNGELGIAFRRQDASNYYVLQAVYDPFAGEAMHLWMTKIENGVGVALDSGMSLDAATPNDTWHWLRVRVKGTTFQAFVDDGAGGWTQVGGDITGQTSYATATRAGIYSASSIVTRQTTRMRTASLAIYTAP